MNKIIKSSLLTILLISSANAVVKDKEIAKCASINGDLSRLECYDNLAKLKKLDKRQSIPTNIKGKGKWEVAIDTNPVDDSKTVVSMLKADSGLSKWGKPIYLVARCSSNKTNLYINWKSYLGREANVLTRIGKNKAVTSYWSISTDSKATFHTSPVDFLKKILTSNKLVAQVTPYNESPITVIFDTTGSEEALKPLRETCNW